MNILNDDNDEEKTVPRAPVEDPVREAEILTSPAQVILDIRKDIEAFKNGGSRKELVEALKDQFIATRHQAATKAEAARMLALNILQARLPEIKSNAELLRVISVLSAVSENDLAVVLDAVPGSGALINVQQLIGLPEREDRAISHPASGQIKDATNISASLESFEHLLKHIKDSHMVEGAGVESAMKENEPDEQSNLIPWRRSRG
jgi:hypothetical protein